MSFRRKRDDWDEFISRHGPELRECGIPDYVMAKKMRFLVFLDHGYDDWGRYVNHGSYFNADLLSDEQIARLALLVACHIDDSYRVPISTRWQRSS
jgi:hypothetical protein